ncbi:hypothetical protein EMA8858_02157 [Emticicia aquatica]|jgi:hypothetical protein|uniref:NUMOD4 domain-containing protein n=1 Tax=Emticicia aquatica TaxID=1681835 RepID=A0ABM9AQP7_9BACT|nr:NUMOD4 domain-containing protein [Emticicia aquatica]CAH0996027.1 hypothetical protein EMA8858_02157 [Emticicia aquatica]
MEKKRKSVPPLRATIRFYSYPNEIWKEFSLKGQSRRYQVSNLGRVASFITDVNVDGFLLKLSRSRTGMALAVKVKEEVNGKTKLTNLSTTIHFLVASHFIENDDPDKIKVIHLDHDRFNNAAANLRWATKDEVWEHVKSRPNYVPRNKGQKLTVERVRLIKRKIAEGKTKQMILAKQFGLSEMAIYRIKTGKNWAEVTI